VRTATGTPVLTHEDSTEPHHSTFVMPRVCAGRGAHNGVRLCRPRRIVDYALMSSSARGEVMPCAAMKSFRKA
jgi:hypothetical protein